MRRGQPFTFQRQVRRPLANNTRWRCKQSPTGAHHWDIDGTNGTCRYCGEVRQFDGLKESKN